MLSASKIPVYEITAAIVPVTEKMIREERVGVDELEKQIGMTTIGIPSILDPYQPAALEDITFQIEQWNHRFYTMTIKEEIITQKEVITKKPFNYSFQGGYGKQLFKEVYRYAEVAVSISELYHFDVIHAHDWMTTPAAILAKKISGNHWLYMCMQQSMTARV